MTNVEHETERFLELLKWTVSHSGDAVDGTVEKSGSDVLNGSKPSSTNKSLKRKNEDMVDSGDKTEDPASKRRSVTSTSTDNDERDGNVAVTSGSEKLKGNDTTDGCCIPQQPTIHKMTAVGDKIDGRPSDSQDELKNIAKKLQQIADSFELQYGQKTIEKSTPHDYRSFSDLVNKSLVGTESGVNKLALFYSIAVSAATMNVHQLVTNWVTQYYKENLAKWVTEHNGLDTVCSEKLS